MNKFLLAGHAVRRVQVIGDRVPVIVDNRGRGVDSGAGAGLRLIRRDRAVSLPLPGGQRHARWLYAFSRILQNAYGGLVLRYGVVRARGSTPVDVRQGSTCGAENLLSTDAGDVVPS